MKTHIILREKGLNPDFKLEGGNFKGTILDLINEFYYTKVIGFEKGKTAKCIKEDSNDDCCGISIENRWKIGDEILIDEIIFKPWGVFLKNKEGQNLHILRAELISYENES